MKKILFAFAVVAGVFTGVAHADNNCTGATYYDSDTDTCIACPAGYDYNQDAGKTDITQCQVHCDGGTYFETAGIVGYTQLEYIESTGTQYIDTGVVPTLQTGVYIRAALTIQNNGDNIIFGASDAGTFAGGNPMSVDIFSNNTLLPHGGTGSSYAQNRVTLSNTVNTIYEYKMNYMNDGKASVNTAEISLGASTSMTSRSLQVFNLNSGGGLSRFRTSGARVYDLILTEDSNISHHFIPARRDNDGIIGMYDTVTETFFMNSGTGTFIAGQDISNGCVNVGAGYYAPASTVNFGSVGTRTACPAGTSTNGADNASACTPCAGATYSDETGMASCKSCPSGYDYNATPGKTDITQCQIHCDAGTWIGEYTQLEYIESTGTQYIDTGELLNADSKIETKFSCNASGNYAVFGAGNGSAYNNGEIALFWNGNKLEAVRPTSNTGSDVLRPNNPVSSYVPIELSYDKSFLTIDNSSYASNWYANYQGANSMYIFGTHRTSSNKFIGNMRLYYFKLYNDGVLSNNFVPVRRNSDGVVGMYDTVTGTFFTNAGTGTFVAGADVAAISECVNVGTGYYAPASTVNYGSVGTRTQCPAGLYTVGYGHGADDANDCGRILHVGDNVIYTRRNKETTPSVNIKMDNGDMFYISLSPTDHTVSRLHFQYNGNEYTAYDDSLFYGERDFDTGAQIVQ